MKVEWQRLRPAKLQNPNRQAPEKIQFSNSKRRDQSEDRARDIHVVLPEPNEMVNVQVSAGARSESAKGLKGTLLRVMIAIAAITLSTWEVRAQEAANPPAGASAGRRAWRR